MDSPLSYAHGVMHLCSTDKKAKQCHTLCAALAKFLITFYSTFQPCIQTENHFSNFGFWAVRPNPTLSFKGSYQELTVGLFVSLQASKQIAHAVPCLKQGRDILATLWSHLKLKSRKNKGVV